MKAVDLRKGKTIIHEGELYVVHDAQHVAKGNKRSYMQAKLKNFKQGNISEVRFRVDDQIEVPFVEGKDYEYLYEDGTGYVVMDNTTFDQIIIPAELMEDAKPYLIPNTKLSCQIMDEQVIAVELPTVMTLEVTETPPVVKGATASAQLKEATLETGTRVRVPGFVEPGQRIRVDTRTGEYIDRAKD